jgi:hypothetical protein
MRTHLVRLAAALLLTGLPPAALAAQRPTPIPSDTAAIPVAAPRAVCGVVGQPDCPPPRFWAGIGLDVAQPIGDFRQHADVSAGVNFSGTVLAAPGSPIGLLVRGGFISYGRDRERIIISNGFFQFPGDLETSNSYFSIGAGPELALRRGALRPYIGGTVGFGHFGTSQSLTVDSDDPNDADGRAEVWNESLQGDAVLTMSGLGGLRIAIGSLRSPFTIDVGARYVRNGEAEYVEEGGVVQNDDGSYDVTVTRSRADFVAYTLGVSFGFGGGRR